jgi:2-methylcitrate dehydratase PrpD
MTMAEVLRDWIYDFDLDRAPEDILSDGRLRVLDTFGLCLAAADTPLGRSIHTGALSLPGAQGGDATVIGFGSRCPPQTAALVNGTLAHAMDFDDTHLPSLVHPSAPIVSVALALAEVFGRSGADVLAAVIAGNEAACRLGTATPGAFHRNGLHPTGILCTPIAAVVSARLMGLDRAQALNALGIACSQSSGVLESYKDGTWVKTLHPGWSAHAGIVAAYLAQSGFSGPATGLDGRFGVLRAMIDGPSTELDETAVTGDLGQRWETRANFYKLYPCAHVILPFIEMARAARGGSIDPDRIVRIIAEIPERYIPVVCEPRPEKIAPKTNTHARASLAYAVAAAMAHGRVGVEEYSDAAISDPAVLAIAQRVEHAPLDPVPEGDGFPGALTIEFADGTRERHVLVSRSGHPSEPGTPASVIRKFREITETRLAEKSGNALLNSIITLEKQHKIDGLLAFSCMEPSN